MSLSPPAAEGVGSRSLQALYKEYLRVRHGIIWECVTRLLMFDADAHQHLSEPLPPGSDPLSAAAAAAAGDWWCSESICDGLLRGGVGPARSRELSTGRHTAASVSFTSYRLLRAAVSLPAVRSMVVARLNSPHAQSLSAVTLNAFHDQLFSWKACLLVWLMFDAHFEQ
jgi:hypothetical protein